MRILLTNDDGYDAPGLRALYEAVSGLPDTTVSAIAPAVAKSGKGHSVTEQFTCRQITIEPLGRIIVTDGTPADCVRAAMHLPGHPRPDWVIAGINRGSNLGVDVCYSGTVAAAREAAIMGIPAIAISQLVKSPLPDDWACSTRQAAAIISAICRPREPAPPVADATIHHLAQVALLNQALSAVPISAGQPVAPVRPILEPPARPPVGVPCWNVNLPRLPDQRPPLGVRVAPVSSDPLAFSYEHTAPDAGRVLMTYAGRYHERPATPGTDVALAFAGYITLSPLAIT